jgi:DNA-binding transcriptional ArsR family regulator
MDRSTRPRDPGFEPDVWLDRRQLRVLAHPLRSRLLGALRVDGPATATRLAAALGTNTGATSYHLRQLAEVGLVVEETGHGQGRQRWWRAAHANHGWWHTDFADDPDAQSALDWLGDQQVRELAKRAGQWNRARHGYPRDWQDAATLSDFILKLSPDRVQALKSELFAVVERYGRETVAHPDAAQVRMFLYLFPRAEDTS